MPLRRSAPRAPSRPLAARSGRRRPLRRCRRKRLRRRTLRHHARARFLTGLRSSSWSSAASLACSGTARRTFWRERMTGRHARRKFAALFGHRRRLARPARRKSGASSRQAAGAAERLTELLRRSPGDRSAGANPEPLPIPRPGDASSSQNVHFAYPARSGASRCTGLSFNVTLGRDASPSSALPAPARARSSRCCCASTIRSRVRSGSTASTCAEATPARTARPHGHRAAGRDHLRRFHPRQHRLQPPRRDARRRYAPRP